MAFLFSKNAPPIHLSNQRGPSRTLGLNDISIAPAAITNCKHEFSFYSNMWYEKGVMCRSRLETL